MLLAQLRAATCSTSTTTRRGGAGGSSRAPRTARGPSLGLSVLLLAVARLVRRRVVPLPPWAEQLSAAERRWEHRTEQALFLACSRCRLVLKHQLVQRDGLLRRML